MTFTICCNIPFVDCWRDDVNYRPLFVGLRPTDLSTINTVYSHPQPFQQCANSLIVIRNGRLNIPKVRLRNGKGCTGKITACCCVGKRSCGTLYGLQVLERIEANQRQNSPDLWCWHVKPLTCLTRFQRNDVVNGDRATSWCAG